MGAINFDERYARPIGTVKAVMLFVDFPDAPATVSADTLFEDYFSPEATDWLTSSSYGRLDLEISPVRRWLRVPELLSSFTFPGGYPSGADAKRYINHALSQADTEVNFAEYRIVFIVPRRGRQSVRRRHTHVHAAGRNCDRRHADPNRGDARFGHLPLPL